MFEWLKNLLFDEEVEIEEDKLEKIDFTKVNDIDKIVEEPQQKEIVIEEKKVEEIKEEPIPIIKKEFNIQLNEPKKEVNKKENKLQEEIRPRRERLEKKQTENKEIEIGTVISPIFGGKDMKKSETSKQPIQKIKKRDSLGTVISPMYGQAELLKHEKEAQNKINEVKEAVVINDDWKDDIPLEELISNETENNDCVQFSLFGDDQLISE